MVAPWWISMLVAVGLFVWAMVELSRNAPKKSQPPISQEIKLLIGVLVLLWIMLGSYVQGETRHFSGPLGRAAILVVLLGTPWIASWIPNAVRKRFEPKEKAAESEDSTA